MSVFLMLLYWLKYNTLKEFIAAACRDIYINLIIFVIGRGSKNLEKLSHPVRHKMTV